MIHVLGRRFAAEQFSRARHVADTAQCPALVRYVSLNGSSADIAPRLLMTLNVTSRRDFGATQHVQRADKRSISYSITSSATASTLGGMVRPNVLAVVWLITISNLVGCVTGRSAGFSPLRMRAA